MKPTHFIFPINSTQNNTQKIPNLFAALPGAGKRGNALDAPEGGVPPLDRQFPGCRFAERCPAAFDRCDEDAPAWHHVGAQSVRCHLYEGVSIPRPLMLQTSVAAAQHRQRAAQPVLAVRDLTVHFPVRKGLLKRTVGHVKAADGVSLRLAPGRTLALVGESGCGKTTVGKAILRLIERTAGELFLDGESIGDHAEDALAPLRRAVQMVFQDPFASLNPRMRVGEIIEEGLSALGIGADVRERRARVIELLERVGLSEDMRWRYPHEFSGGQRQRIAVARALAVSPRVIVCDEPTSALDVSVQAQLLNLMRALQHERGLAYLFITHNLAVVEYLADEVAVMYLGRIVEEGPVERVLGVRAHPYTRALLAAVPRVGAEHGEGARDHAADATTVGATLEFLQEPVSKNGLTFLSVRPNPVAERFTATYYLPEAGETTLRLTDATGRVLQTVQSNRERGYNETEFDVKDAEPGLLFLRLDGPIQEGSSPDGSPRSQTSNQSRHQTDSQSDYGRVATNLSGAKKVIDSLFNGDEPDIKQVQEHIEESWSKRLNDAFVQMERRREESKVLSNDGPSI